MTTLDLTKYNGKIYSVRNSFALKFNSGSFHYVTKEQLKQAANEGFQIGYDKMTYSNMPWGMQHSGYCFETNDAIISDFNKYINE